MAECNHGNVPDLCLECADAEIAILKAEVERLNRALDVATSHCNVGGGVLKAENASLKVERDAAVKILKELYGKALDGCKKGRIDLSSHIFDMIACWLRSETKEANIDL